MTRLSRIGFDNSLGFLVEGIDGWKANGGEIDTIKRITPVEFEAELRKKIDILDVRKTGEYDAEHIEGAENLPLDEVNTALAKIDHNKTYYVHCAGGYRSVIFESILKARGFHNMIDIGGGFKGIREQTSIKCTAFKCASEK